ncbi:glycoside hydrolase family 3 protein [Piromyces sp. E2]|nr:glycoside hydrolase family 3 protein [Piromyces sp. E2]|eukprot:OUM59687.1 glycoside hydrolase family 3 protein [Piromyces sp. E2]
MKCLSLIVLTLLLINLIYAGPIVIKKKCIPKHKKNKNNHGLDNGLDNGNNSQKEINNDTNSAETVGDMNQYEIDHINTIDKYIAECTVLLRRNGDFPIGNEFKEVYLFGNGGRKTIKGGTGSGDVNSRSFETIEQAFTNAGFTVKTTDYLDAYDKAYIEAKDAYKKKLHSDPEIMANVMTLMGATMPEPELDIPYVKEGDFAVYVLSRISGEGTDRKVIKGDVYLTDYETKIIKDLAKGFKKFILVLNTGGPVDLSGLDSVKNILVLSQLGVNTSKTLVDVIVGNKYPSGKLATTWTKFEDYPTIGDFGDENDTHYKEGVYVGYRYFDTENVDVMYPFGFGLGYTDFKFDIKNAKLVGEKFEVTTTVRNIGKFKGKEVLELYLSKPNTTLDEPYQILVGFAKTKELNPNEKATLKINFKLSDFASYDTKTATYILDKGSYVVRVGNSSRNTKPCGVIKVKSRIDVRKVANKMGKPEFEDYVPKVQRKSEDLSKVRKFTLNAHSIKPQTVKYNKKFEIAEAVKAMTDEEKARLVIGVYQDGPAEVVGNASITTAGAAGETARVGGLEPIVMADGPAGLRIAKDYYVDEYGAHAVGSTMESMIEFFPDEIKAMFGGSAEAPKDAKIEHQYTTAIPIGTAIAQSWNKEFAEICGDIVGAEMKLFKIDLWLAPALNIHRSILNGRNFEYYSEDPFISGTFATAITKGVQKHPQRFVTIKHYAANGQETNRYGSNSHVSERALREIYLRGFEMCIRDANPRAVMTSFNLINGVHANQSKELTTDILRTEFGFDGLVMTDWIVFGDKNNKYPQETSDGVIKAGGDLFMPGSQKDYDNVLGALKNKTLSVEELELSASNIYRLAMEIEQ